MALRLRRGTDAERQLITPVEGELIYTTDTKLLYVGDGSTAGGSLVTGAGGGSSTLDALTDTNLTGSADGEVLTFVAGTNKWTPVSIAELFNEQQNYKINIVGDDSTIIIDTDTNNITGNTIIANNIISNLEGSVTGDLTGSVFSDDSSIIIDGLNGNGHFSSIISTAAQLTIGRATGISELRLESFQTRNRLNINTVDKTGDLSAYSGYYGTLNFGFEDATTDRSDCTIRGQASDMRIAHDTVTEFISDESKYFTLKEGKFGFGTYTPAEKLDVRGNIVATGTIQPGVYADAAARDAALTAPTAGQMVYITDVAKFQGNTDGTITGWANLN